MVTIGHQWEVIYGSQIAHYIWPWMILKDQFEGQSDFDGLFLVKARSRVIF